VVREPGVLRRPGQVRQVGECFGEPAVQPGPLLREQPGFEDLLEQPAGEPVPVLADVDDPPIHGSAYRVEQLILVELHHGGQQRMVDRLHPGGERGGDPVRVRRQLADLAQRQRPQRLGQRRHAVAVPAREDFDDERVPAAAPPQQVALPSRQRPAGDPLGQRLGVSAVQRLQFQDRDRRLAAQLVEQPADPMPIVQRVGPRSAEQQQAAGTEAGQQVAQQPLGGPVRPVQVVDHQDQRPSVGDRHQRVGHPVQQRGRVVGVRHRRVQTGQQSQRDLGAARTAIARVLRELAQRLP
jgi:hypothetical protein